MPAAKEYRDMAYYWKPGYFLMDEAVLRVRLRRAELVLGPIAETVPTIVTCERFRNSAISAVFFDVDYYSSTTDAFQAFTAPAETRLPRVMCYMDDVVGELEWYSDFTGVLGAIADFNRLNDTMKFSPLYLAAVPDHRLRSRQLMMLHDFAHPGYNTFVGDDREARPASTEIKISTSLNDLLLLGPSFLVQ